MKDGGALDVGVVTQGCSHVQELGGGRVNIFFYNTEYRPFFPKGALNTPPSYHPPELPPPSLPLTPPLSLSPSFPLPPPMPERELTEEV